jgi:hypothetical protein
MFQNEICSATSPENIHGYYLDLRGSSNYTSAFTTVWTRHICALSENYNNCIGNEKYNYSLFLLIKRYVLLCSFVLSM